MADLKNVLQGLTTTDAKIIERLAGQSEVLQAYFGKGFETLGELTLNQTSLSLKGARVIYKGTLVDIDLTTNILNNYTTFVAVNKSTHQASLVNFNNITLVDGVYVYSEPNFNSNYAYYKVCEYYANRLHDFRYYVPTVDKLSSKIYPITITEDMWEEVDGEFFFTITHNLETRNILVSMVDEDDGQALLDSYAINSDNSITTFSVTRRNAQVTIIALNTTFTLSNSIIDDTIKSHSHTYSSIYIDTIESNLNNLSEDVNDIRQDVTYIDTTSVKAVSFDDETFIDVDENLVQRMCDLEDSYDEFISIITNKLSKFEAQLGVAVEDMVDALNNSLDI